MLFLLYREDLRVLRKMRDDESERALCSQALSFIDRHCKVLRESKRKKKRSEEEAEDEEKESNKKEEEKKEEEEDTIPPGIPREVGQSNERKYLVAVQNETLRQQLREIPGLPIIFLQGVILILEQPSHISKRKKKASDLRKQRSLEGEERDLIRQARFVPLSFFNLSPCISTLCFLCLEKNMNNKGKHLPLLQL